MFRAPVARALAIGIPALCLPALAAAQGLGDVAAKERQKRTTSQPKASQPTRAYDNQDLDERRPADARSPAKSGSTAARAASTTAQAAQAQPSPVADVAGAEAQASERSASLSRAEADLEAAQETVQAIERRIRELQDKLNPMSPSYVYGAFAARDAPGDEMRTKQELARLPSDLAEAQQALEQARRALERARSGSPAGR